ncbi:hypothetical protein MARINOS108_11632 [Marinoscillum sp. 108]|nr:hypothetical protein MARINOS108_11632 [Marinoscillum sp. 108]
MNMASIDLMIWLVRRDQDNSTYIQLKEDFDKVPHTGDELSSENGKTDFWPILRKGASL